MIQTGEQFRAYIESELGDGSRPIFSDKAVFFGVVKTNGNFGVVALDNYTHYDIELSYAGNHFLSRTLLAVIFNNVFIKLKCHRCTSRITADNDKAISIVERLGFVHEGTLRQAYEGNDVLVHGLLKSECRYI